MERSKLRIAGILVGIATLSGCVERRYTLRTDPPGALAIVNGEEIGPTPISSRFVYYGDREITLLRDGCETLHVIQPIKAPWWDNKLTEFFTENLVPFTLRDEREFTYKLAPAFQPPRNELMERGESLRTQGQQPPPPRRGGILGFFGF
jgi:hypothetical protein